MQNSSPKKVAFIAALLISLVSLIIFYILIYNFANFSFLYFLIFPLAVFIFSYFIINYSFDKFIYEKIRIIYQTIGKLKTMDDQKPVSKKSSGDVLEIVNQVVFEWSQEQKKEIEELKKMAAYRREFLGNISHELKTPIFNIQGYILTLLDGGLEDPEINRKFLESTKKSINRMIAIVEDLEEISKFESGELKLKMANFDLNLLIREVMEFMEMKAGQYQTKINFNIPASKPFIVSADKKRIKQVLINLIDNAIKYGDETNGKINISIYDFHDYYLTEISDNGIGIPEEYLFRVFERFFRTEKSRSRKEGGSGLGLAIVKHIIEAHNQKISVRNNPDKGTTFSFSLKKIK